MKLAMFRASGRDRIGVIEGDAIVDVTAGLPSLSHELADWLPGLSTSWRMLAIAARESTVRLPLSSVRLLPPVRRPSAFLAIGGNYASHIREIAHLNVTVGEHQVWFNKQASCITGPFDEIVIPAGTSTLDYEVELAVIIGRRCRNVAAKDAADYIAGYTICNDASIRERHHRSPTITLAKSFDSLGPLGPWMVTADEIADPRTLQVRTWVNGELRQDGSTSEMRFDIFEQIEELSHAMTLEPGDVLATGTPAGIGAARQPPVFLSPGDVVRMQIEGIGVIENRVVASLPASI